MQTKLTKRQAEALWMAFRKGGAWDAHKGSKAGGAYARMCRHLAEQGLLANNAPYPITTKGLSALRDEKARRWALHGSMATLLDMEKVEAALAEATA